MPLTVQVAVDCREPHALADWWAETLGWTVEPQDADFIRRMVAEGHATADETTEHAGRLVGLFIVAGFTLAFLLSRAV